jgi:hypothetical protein
MARKKPRKSKLMSLHPAGIAFLLDDESYCRPNVPRDRVSLASLRRGESQLMFGRTSLTAYELLAEYGEKALSIFQAAHPGELPSWWKMLTAAEQQALK